MLNALRKRAGGWLAQIFIALLVVSFAVWGVSDIFRGFRTDTIAQVGGTDISVQAFQRQYDLAVRQLSQQMRQPVTNEQARLFGVPSQVLSRLATDATLTDEAATLGLGISSDTLAMQVAEDPTFRGSSGTFDRNNFAQILRSNGLTEDQYLQQLRASYIRRQIADALVGDTEVPDAYLRALHEYRSEERDISYVTLAPALVGDIADPSDTELTEYFEASKAEWRAPEYRAMRVVRMAPKDLADTSEVSDDDVRAAYDQQAEARFTTPERRRVEQIVFKNEAEAGEAAAALSGGKSFSTLIAERNMTAADADLGLVAQREILDPKVAEAAFSLAADGVSGVIEGRFGPVIVHVTEIQPAEVQPFDEVAPQVRRELAEQRAGAEIADLLNVVEDARAGGDTLSDIAPRYDLPLIEIAAVDSSGNDADGNPIADLPGGSELVAAAFESDVGVENNPLSVDDGYVWYEVTGVTAERDRQLSEVHDKVIAAWKKEQVDQQLSEKADAIRERLANGEDIAAIANEAGLTVETATAVTRASAPTVTLSAAAIQAAFAGPVGTAVVADGVADQSKTVLVVNNTTVPPYFSGLPEMAESEAQLSEQMANDLLQQYIAQLQSELGVTVNQTTLQQVIGTGTGTGI